MLHIIVATICAECRDRKERRITKAVRYKTISIQVHPFLQNIITAKATSMRNRALYPIHG